MTPGLKSSHVMAGSCLDLTPRLTFSKSLLQQVMLSLELRDKVTAIQILFKFLELKINQTR